MHGDFVGADLRTANLTRATLKWTDLTRAQADYADLTEVDLTGARLGEAILIVANLRGADLTTADLGGARRGGRGWTARTATRSPLGRRVTRRHASSTPPPTTPPQDAGGELARVPAFPRSRVPAFPRSRVPAFPPRPASMPPPTPPPTPASITTSTSTMASSWRTVRHGARRRVEAERRAFILPATLSAFPLIPERTRLARSGDLHGARLSAARPHYPRSAAAA
ncbi:pentapeptide repeat-containing protein [Actinosynnema sp. CA-299493]